MSERIKRIKEKPSEYAEYLNDGDRIEVNEDEIRLYNHVGCMIASRRVQ